MLKWYIQNVPHVWGHTVLMQYGIDCGNVCTSNEPSLKPPKGAELCLTYLNYINMTATEYHAKSTEKSMCTEFPLSLEISHLVEDSEESPYWVSGTCALCDSFKSITI
jgi:hypothetical protein